jgi:glycine/D-amino acid oxidase-like deaminating enzyme
MFDVIVIGGGIIGCAAAYYLKIMDPSIKIAILERDPSYTYASTTLSFGVIRTQFSLKESIMMSQFTLEVLDRFEEEMAWNRDGTGVIFRKNGYLFLYSEQDEPMAAEALKLQLELGCCVEWWTQEEIQRHYPLMVATGLTDLTGGIFSVDDGYLDPYIFLMAYRNKAISLGVRFIKDEMSVLLQGSNRVRGVRLTSGSQLEAPVVLNATGAWATRVAITAGLKLPIDSFMLQAFAFKPAVNPKKLPFVVVPSGVYFRPEIGSQILVGLRRLEDKDNFNFRWERKRFIEFIWPELAKAIPAFDTGRLLRGWAGLISQTRLDANPILGEWPDLPGFYLTNGCSGHGLMHAPAIGRAIAEMILDREPSLDLSILGPERILANRPLKETCLF